ncbi:hypothetical protein [Spiroplasma alleghenense]|uniref:Uncharacterized protein n=1 Tax=Spiroplasma alleghenense TaxID=216931 RepID=A0A345Z3T1_9MOLU|nr:hypothetical protein [Spiroplasma alleghenense]AXK51260.1 hypothetical protein SALLE_v1c05880 [Spiroplasma alleghenense]
MKERNYKDITGDYEIINKYILSYKIPREFQLNIKRNFDLIGQMISKSGKLKLITDLSSEFILESTEELNLKAVALKYINFSNFQNYEKLIGLSNDKESKTDKLSEFQIEIIKKLKLELINKPFEIKLPNRENNELVISWEIAGRKINLKILFCLDSKQIYQIVNRNKKYELNFDLHLSKEYRTLNQLLFKKLDFLFLSLLLDKNMKLSRKDIDNLKKVIISDIQVELNKNEYMRKWVSLVFKKFLKNEVYVDDLFKTQDFYFKSSKIFTKIYNSFKLKKLNYVFSMTYPNLDEFISKYTEFAKSFLAKYNSREYEDLDQIYHLYEFNPYLTSKGLNKNVLIRNWERLNEESNLRLMKKYIYPDNKEIGTFVLFSIFYKLDLE